MKTYTSVNIVAFLASSISVHATVGVNVAVDTYEFSVNDPNPSNIGSRRLHHRSSSSSMSFELYDISSKSGKAGATKDPLFTRHLVDVDELERELHHKTGSYSYDTGGGGKSGKAIGGRRLLDIDELDRLLYHKAGSFSYSIHAEGKSGKATSKIGGRRVLDLDELERELKHIMVSMSLGEVEVEKGGKSSKVTPQPQGKRNAGKSHKGKQARRFLDVEEFDRELEEMTSISMSIAPIVVAGSKSQKGVAASASGTIDAKASKSERASSADGYTTVIELEESGVGAKGKAPKISAIVSKDDSNNKSGKSQKGIPAADITRSSTSETLEGDEYKSYIEIRSSLVAASDGSEPVTNGVNAAEGSDAVSSAIVKKGFASLSLMFLAVTAYVVF